MTNSKIFSYRCPTEIYLGVNSHEKLGDIISGWKVKRLLFLPDEGVASTEIFKSVESILKGNRVTLDIFTDIEPDPSDKTVEKAYELYRKSQPSVILALVGGWQKSH